MHEPFRVLHVCTGNLCRSPVSEHLMRAGLQARGLPSDAVEVASAGTLGRPGAPMEPYALDVLAERGLDGSAFRTRRLLAEQVEQADLVLTATRRHRTQVAELVAGAARRTFTLLELARLADGLDLAGDDPAQRLRALVPAALALRSPAGQPADDLADPYRGPRRGFVACAEAVDGALQVVLEAVAPGGPGPALPAPSRRWWRR